MPDVISRTGVGTDPGSDGGLHGFKIGLIGVEAAGMGHQVAEGDLANVGAFSPISRQVVNDLGVVRDVLLVQELGHSYGSDELADAGHVHLLVWIPALAAVRGRLGPLPLQGPDGMAVLAEPHGIAGYLVFQSGMQGLAEGVNVEMVPHAQAADNRPSGHELNLALISPVIADDSDDVLRPHHVVAHTVLINGQIFDVRGQGTMQVFGGNASCRSVKAPLPVESHTANRTRFFPATSKGMLNFFVPKGARSVVERT